MGKFKWENGTLVSKAKVEVSGQIYEVEPEQYSGTTPLTAENLNQMQDGIYEDIGDLEQLNTSDKSSLVNAINELIKPQVLVKDKTINVNINSSSVRGNFTVETIEGYTLSSVQAVNVPSGDSNTINFNITSGTVYWLVTRQGYSNTGNMVVRLLYVRDDLISQI